MIFTGDNSHLGDVVLHVNGTQCQGNFSGWATSHTGLDVPNLHILWIGNIPGMSTNSIMPFHNHVSSLVLWLSRLQQIWSCRVHNFCRSAQHLFRVQISISLKSTALAMYVSYAKLKHRFCLRPSPLRPIILTRGVKALLKKTRKT